MKTIMTMPRAAIIQYLYYERKTKKMKSCFYDLCSQTRITLLMLKASDTCCDEQIV